MDLLQKKIIYFCSNDVLDCIHELHDTGRTRWLARIRTMAIGWHSNRICQRGLPCYGSVQLSLDQTGKALITPAMIISDKLPSYAKFKAVILETGKIMQTVVISVYQEV